MSDNRIEIESDSQWHELRSKTVGSSEVASLFGLSPYKTAYTLWHEKAGKVPVERGELNERTRWGKMLEPLIAGEVTRLMNWSLKPARQYWRHPTVPGMGASLDFDVIDHEWGPGIVETKVVFEYKDYMEKWGDDRAPPEYEMQVQQQLACTGANWAGIVVWIAQTATMKPALIRRRNDKVINAIETRIGSFWQSIKDGLAPSPAGLLEEMDVVRQLWPAREPKKIVKIGDPNLANNAQLFNYAKEQEAGFKRQYDASRVILLGAAKDAELLRVPGYDIYVKQDKRGAFRMEVKENAANGVVPGEDAQWATILQ